MPLADVIAFYEKEYGDADRVIAAHPLDAKPHSGIERDIPSLRWIVLHRIEETARHSGHADIARELIDGKVGHRT